MLAPHQRRKKHSHRRQHGREEGGGEVSHKHIRRFRSQVRAMVAEGVLNGHAPETINSTATIYARHWVTGGPLTPMQALRGCAMVTGTPMELVTRNNRTGARILMWPPAQGETWAGKLRNGFA